MMVGDAQNEVVRFMPSNRRGDRVRLCDARVA